MKIGINKMDFDKVMLSYYFYRTIIIIIWFSINIRFIEEWLKIQEIFDVSSFILELLLLVIFQFIFELWVSIYISEINWISDFFALSILIILNVLFYFSEINFFMINKPYFYAISLILMNLIFGLFYFYENTKINRYRLKKYQKYKKSQFEILLKNLSWIMIILVSIILALPFYKPI